MTISNETQQLVNASQSILKKTLNQKEIDGLTHFIDVLNRQDGNLTKEEQVVLETFFENAVNNQDLNKRISKAMKSLPAEMEAVLSALTQVRSFCYKTRFINNIDGINKKIVRNLELSENNQTIVASEKIHLSEIGMLTDTLKSKDIIDFLDSYNIITLGGSLDKIKSEISSSEDVLQRLNKAVDSGMDVQSGDITHTNKQNALMNRDPKSFFEKAKNHVTKYQHAATLYKRDDATLLESYNTYIDHVEDYINFLDNLNELHMQEFVRLNESGSITKKWLL